MRRVVLNDQPVGACLATCRTICLRLDKVAVLKGCRQECKAAGHRV